MRRLITAFAISAAFIGASAANAAATYTFNDGNGGLSAGEVLYADFSTTNGSLVGGSIQTGSTSGIAADPAVGGQGDPYLAVLGGTEASFTFAGGISQLGLDYGSADYYNTFVLTFLDGTTQTLTGTQIITDTADGNQTEPRTNGRLTFFAGDNAITGLTLQSSQNSLEVDNFGVAGAVPEPATWAMMLLGFGAIGAGMRRRRPARLQTA